MNETSLTLGNIIVPLVTSLVTSVITTIFMLFLNHLFHKKTKQFDKQFEIKEERYKSVIMFMEAVIKPENYTCFSFRVNPPANSTNDSVRDFFIEQLKLEINYLFLFSTPKVIDSLNKFIKEQNKYTLNKTIEAMRADLFGKNQKY